jgi:hypothetical protein
MTMQNVIGGVILPHPRPSMSAEAFQVTTVDADGEKAAMIVPCTKTGNFKKIRWAGGAVTTSGDLEVRVETVSLTDGNPTGTLVDANLTVTVTVTTTTEQEAVFATAAQVTAGTLIAIVIQRNAGSSFAGNVTYANNAWGAGNTLLGFTYVAANIAGAWTKDDLAPNICIEYDDGTRMVTPFFHYMSAPVTSDAWNDTTAGGDRIGLRFKPPFKCRLFGMGCVIDNDGDFEALLYDTDGATILASTSVLDAQQRESAGSVGSISFLPFTTSVVLTAGSFYRVVIHPTTATNCTMVSSNVVTAADLDCQSGGQDFHYTKNGTASAPTQEADWTQTLTRRPPIWLFFDQLDDGAGGSVGNSIHVIGQRAGDHF